MNLFCLGIKLCFYCSFSFVTVFIILCETIATNVTIATTTIILYLNVSGIYVNDKKAERNTAINGMNTWLLDFLFMVNPPKTICLSVPCKRANTLNICLKYTEILKIAKILIKKDLLASLNSMSTIIGAF
jgi:hypothetical protein